MYRLIFLLFLFCVSKLVGGQIIKTQTIRGQVIDSGTELPIAGATIVYQSIDTLLGTFSDANGYFRLDNIPVGRTTIRIQCVGYAAQTLSELLLTSGKELVLTIRLVEKLYDLKAVEILGGTDKGMAMNEMAIISARSFSISETERYAGSLGDPARMASNFAGVSAASDQRNDIIIRGNSPSGVLWRLEGVEIPNPNHFSDFGSTGGAISMINNNTLSRSDFYTGAFPAEFGNALSGVFDLNLRSGNNEKQEFLAQFGFYSFEAGIEGPLLKPSKSSYLLNMRYSTMEVFRLLGTNFGIGQAIPKFMDATLKLNILTKNAGRISFFALGGNCNIELLDSRGDAAGYGLRGSDLYLSNGMYVTGLSHTFYFADNSRIISTISASESNNKTTHYDIFYSTEVPDFTEKGSEKKYSANIKYIKKFDAANLIKTGASYNFFDINFSGYVYDTINLRYINYLDARGQLSSARAFFDWQHRFTNNLTLNTGLFCFYYFFNNSYAIEPRIALRWNFKENKSISIGAGMHSQTQFKAIHFINYLTDTVNMTYTKSNKYLDLSRSLHFIAGYDQTFKRNKRLKAEIYFQRLYNIPIAVQQPQFSFINMGSDYGYTAFENMLNTGTGENYGLELTWEKFLDRGFYYLLTASLFNATYRGYDGIKRNSRFNNNFVLNILCGYEFPVSKSGVIVTDFKIMYAGGQRYIPIDAETSALENRMILKWDEAFEHKNPNYFRLNFRIGFRFDGKNTSHECAIDFQNVTNHQNVFMRTWDNRNKEIVTSYQMGFIPILIYRIHL